MDYALLDGHKQQEIRAQHLLGLEAEHYRFTLQEAEEPGASNQRVAALAELERRIADHRAALGLIPDADQDEAESEFENRAAPATD